MNTTLPQTDGTVQEKTSPPSKAEPVKSDTGQVIERLHALLFFVEQLREQGCERISAANAHRFVPSTVSMDFAEFRKVFRGKTVKRRECRDGMRTWTVVVDGIEVQSYEHYESTSGESEVTL